MATATILPFAAVRIESTSQQDSQPFRLGAALADYASSWGRAHGDEDRARALAQVSADKIAALDAGIAESEAEVAHLALEIETLRHRQLGENFEAMISHVSRGNFRTVLTDWNARRLRSGAAGMFTGNVLGLRRLNDAGERDLDYVRREFFKKVSAAFPDDGSANLAHVILNFAFLDQAPELSLLAAVLWCDLRRMEWAATYDKYGRLKVPRGDVCPKRKTLAKRYHCKLTALDTAIKQLRGGGYLRTEKRDHESNLYFPIIPDRIKLDGFAGYSAGPEAAPGNPIGAIGNQTTPYRESDNLLPEIRQPPLANQIQYKSSLQTSPTNLSNKVGVARDARAPSGSVSVSKSELPTPRPREGRFPTGFTLSPEMRKFAVEKRVNPEQEFEAFEDNAKAKGLEYVDWSRAWQTWCRRAVEFGRGNYRPPPPNIRDLDRDHVPGDPENAKRARAIVIDALKKMGAAA